MARHWRGFWHPCRGLARSFAGLFCGCCVRISRKVLYCLRVVAWFLAGLFHNSAAGVRRAFRLVCSALLGALEWVGEGTTYVLATRLARRLIAVMYGVSLALVVAVIAYLLVSCVPAGSRMAWVALVGCPSVAVFWVMRWVVLIAPGDRPKAFHSGNFASFYLVSTFTIVVVLFAWSYLSANKLGNNIVHTASRAPVVRPLEYVHFSLVTATTLGDSDFEALGVGRAITWFELAFFWILVVIVGAQVSVSEDLGGRDP